jgi:hypothetical protein
MQIREGWYLGLGALFAAAGAILGLLILLGVAPNGPVIDGSAIVLIGVSRVLP